jgi:hypothetical protein
MANIQWYYSRGNADMQGPVSPAELARLAQAGELRPGDLVWKEGMEEWIAADRIKGLEFPSASPVQPTPAPPVQTVSAPPVQTGSAPLEQYAAPPVTAASRHTQPKSRNVAGPLWFLDLDFNHLISTAIVRGIWALYLILSALGVVYSVIQYIKGLPITYALGYCAAMIFLYAITTLLVRLMLEGAMVLFRISEDLRAIRDIATVSQSERPGASLPSNGTY